MAHCLGNSNTASLSCRPSDLGSSLGTANVRNWSNWDEKLREMSDRMFRKVSCPVKDLRKRRTLRDIINGPKHQGDHCEEYKAVDAKFWSPPS